MNAFTVVRRLSASLMCLTLAACNEDPSCDLDSTLRQGQPREEITQSTLVLQLEKGEWKPEKIVRFRKWKDLGRHFSASGTVELFHSRAGEPFATAPAEGPLPFTTRSLHGQSDPGGQILANTHFSLKLPDYDLTRTTNPVRHVRWTPAPGSGRQTPLWIDLTGITIEDRTLTQRTSGLTSPYPFEVLHWSGDPRYRLNLVILADGYQADQMELYRQAAKAFYTEVFGYHRPYNDYLSMINIVRIDTKSRESGADCEDGRFSLRDTRYGSSFPVACLNALIGTKFNDRFLYQLDMAQVEFDSATLLYNGVSIADETFVIVHSNKRAGTAILWATQTDSTDWKIASHELGHSWGRLADEYVMEGDLCLPFMATSPNLSLRTSSRENLKWKEWTLNETPLPTPNRSEYDGVVGLFPGGAGGCESLVYHPTRRCKMDHSEDSFCPVCMEQMILRLYDRINPIQGPLVRERATVTAPVALGERMRTRWFVNDKMVQETREFQPLKAAFRSGDDVRLSVFEENAPVRRDRCHLEFSVRKNF